MEPIGINIDYLQKIIPRTNLDNVGLLSDGHGHLDNLGWAGVVEVVGLMLVVVIVGDRI